MTTAELVADITATATLPLNRASTLPRSAYTDEDFFVHEAKTILAAGWLCAAHVSQLKTPGAILPVDFLNEPIMLVHGEDNIIRAFSRVCPHRSADLLTEGQHTDCSATRSVITCPYHRWSFSLEGKLAGAPQMHQAEDFEKSDWRLSPIRSEIWQGFIFVNLDDKAPPLETQFAQFTKTAAPWKSEELELVISMDWDCHFNWKVMLENWIESYHHLGPHTKTLNPLMPAQDTWSEPPAPGFIHAHLPMTGRAAEPIREAIEKGETGRGFTPIPGLTAEQQSEWNIFIGFPCFMFMLARDRVIWYRLQPISAGFCRVTTTTFVTKAALNMPDYEQVLKNETQMLRDFHLEDLVVNESVQRGLRSSHVVRGRLSHLEEPVWQFHRLLAAQLAKAA
jgi:phenylpropionate dioxygenase-like ring-hydroxylating dioxygenase large terminal subunit